MNIKQKRVDSASSPLDKVKLSATGRYRKASDLIRIKSVQNEIKRTGLAVVTTKKTA